MFHLKIISQGRILIILHKKKYKQRVIFLRNFRKKLTQMLFICKRPNIIFIIVFHLKIISQGRILIILHRKKYKQRVIFYAILEKN